MRRSSASSTSSGTDSCTPGSRTRWSSVSARGVGIATEIVGIARDQAEAAGCEWLHVDFDDHLRSFYYDACGFRPTHGGLIALQEVD